MSIKKLLLLFLATIFISSCTPYRVIHITNESSKKLINKPGFYYSLPNTVLKIEILVRQNNYNKGSLSDYTEKYLGLSNFIKSDQVDYDIIDVKINSFPQRDPNQYYFVKKNKCLKRNSSLSVFFNDDGMLQSINEPVKSEDSGKNIELFENRITKENKTEFLFSLNVNEKIDTIIQNVKSDTMTIEKRIFRKRSVEKSSDEKAKEAADYLKKLRENQLNVITGYAEVPYSMETTKYMKEQLKEEERSVMALFTGDTTHTIIKYSFYYMPDKSELISEKALFNFNTEEGGKKLNENESDVITIRVEKKIATSQLSKFQTLMDTPKNNKNGFYYRIPEYANVSIRKSNKLLAEDEILISQFGVVSHLPLNIRKVVFNPNLGSVRRIKL